VWSTALKIGLEKGTEPRGKKVVSGGGRGKCMSKTQLPAAGRKLRATG